MPQIKMTAAVLKNTHSAAKLFLQFYNQSINQNEFI